MSQPQQTGRDTEIIAVSSGKGGTGKTLFTACLGHALHRSGHRVLLIDADTGTDGLSLFLLGEEGPRQSTYLGPQHTVRGFLDRFGESGEVAFEAFEVNRTYDHEVKEPYHVLISGKGLYGDEGLDLQPVPPLERGKYGEAWSALFAALRGQYDYVLVDTRGGFAYESTDVAARADSFILVTEPDLTSFYQDSNLVRHISNEADRVGRPATLSAVIVNKATEGKEESFRSILSRDLPVRFEETYPLPLDLDAIRAYKVHQVPFVPTPGAPFCSALISALSDILHVVVAQWPSDRIERWNALVRRCAAAFEERAAERSEMDGQSVVVAEASARAESLARKVADLEQRLAEARSDKDDLTQLMKQTVMRDAPAEPEAAMAAAAAPSRPAEVAAPAQRTAGLTAVGRWVVLALVVILGAVQIGSWWAGRGVDGDGQRALLTWPAVPSATGYLVQFRGSSADPDSTWHQALVNELPVPREVGKSFVWRVRAVNEKGERARASEWYREWQVVFRLPGFGGEQQRQMEQTAD